MNERIAELNIRAWEQVNELHPAERERDTWFSKFFAQLIVDECSEICSELSDEYREAAETQGISNEPQAKALFIAASRMKAQLGE